MALSVALASGCATVEYPAPPLPPREESPSLYVAPIEQDYRLQVGDALAIRSYFDAQLNQEVVVRPDGKVSVLLIGDILVTGMTPQELAARIREPYKRLVGGTDVTVALTRSAGMNVYLSGEVRAPSLLQMDGNLTLLQAMARAGGTLPSANTGNVLLIRNRDDGTLMVSKVDLEKILRNESPDVFLQRRDVVYVPKSEIAQAGQFVEQYINAIVPRFVQLQFGWFNSRVTNSEPGNQRDTPMNTSASRFPGAPTDREQAATVPHVGRAPAPPHRHRGGSPTQGASHPLPLPPTAHSSSRPRFARWCSRRRSSFSKR